MQNKLLDEDGSINTEGDLLLWFNYDRRPSVVVWSMTHQSATFRFCKLMFFPPSPQSLTLAFSWCVLLCIGGFLSVWFNHSLKAGWYMLVDQIRFGGLCNKDFLCLFWFRYWSLDDVHCTKMWRLVLVKHYVLTASLVLAGFCFCFCEICNLHSSDSMFLLTSVFWTAMQRSSDRLRTWIPSQGVSQLW